jgi:hypothetical protein
MQWLLHGSLAPAVGEALARHEHKSHGLEEVGLTADAPAADVLKAAREKQYDLITNDAALAGAPFELDFWVQRSIVFLQLEGGEVEQDDAVERLFARYRRLTPGRLYTVTGSRVKVRQLPGK